MGELVMRIITTNLPSRRRQVDTSLKLEPYYSILSDDQRHQLAAIVFAGHDAVIACWPDENGIDGYALGILKGIEYADSGYTSGLRIAQFPCLPSDIEAHNLSALYGDDRVERQGNLTGYVRRRYGDLALGALDAAERYFERYDHFYKDTTMR